MRFLVRGFSGVLNDGAGGRGLFAAGLVLLVLASYLPAMLWGGLVWDDRVWSRAAAVLDWSGLWTIWFSPSLIEKELHYWPLVYTTFWLEHKIWGLAPAGYHVVNVILHAVNTVLLWRVLGRLSLPGAGLAAAVFAVHPLHVESVAWIIERKDLLSALFYLSAVLAWLSYLESRERWRYGLVLLLFAAGLLSKSIVVTLPAALLIVQWWREGVTTGRDVLRVAPLFLLGLLIVVGDLNFYWARRELGSLDYSFVERLLIAGRALWFYAGKLVWPTDLAVVYPLWDIRADDVRAWLYPVSALGLAVLLWLLRRRIGRGPLAGAVYFAVTLSPMLGFVDFGYMQYSFVADRFQYLAGIGLIAVAAGAAWVGVSRLSEFSGWTNFQRLAALPLGIMLLLLGTQTWRQSHIYADKLVFNRHIIAHNPGARGAHQNLAVELVKRGRTEEALPHARVSVRQYPDCSDCHGVLGLALIRLGRLDEAEPHVRRALDIRPYNKDALSVASRLFLLLRRYGEGLPVARTWIRLQPDAAAPRTALAGLLAGLGRHAEAERHLRRAHAIEPQDIVVIQNLAESIRKQGRYEEALEWYQTGLRVSPDYALAHAGKGHALFRLGRYEAAMKAFGRAVDLSPKLPNAPSLLVMAARAATRLGRNTEAAGFYTRVAEAWPGYARALFRKGVRLARQKRYKKARETLEVVVRLLPDNAPAHSNLGAVLYHLGRNDEALEAFERALAIDPAFKDARNNRRALLYGARSSSPHAD